MPESSALFARITNSKWTEPLYLILACAVALIYRGYPILTKSITGVPLIEHISFDGVYYAQIARNILAGEGPGWEAMIFPVLQPVIIAGLSVVTGLSNYAHLSKLTSLYAGALALIPAYYIAKELFGRMAAVAAVLMMIPYPHLVAISTADTAESLYSLFTLLSIWAGLAAVSKGFRPWTAVLAGFMFGLGYLARPEALIVLAAFLPIMFWRLYAASGAKKALAGVALATVVFAAVCSPYVYFLTTSYGRFVTSSKLPYESIKMRKVIMGMPLTNRDVYGITPSGRLAWQENGGAHLIAGYIKSDPRRFFGSYLKNLASELPWQVRNASHMRGYPRVYPLYFWIPAFLGFGVLAARKRTLHMAGMSLIPFGNMFVYPVFTDGFWVYHAPYVPVIVILAVGGLAALLGMLRLGTMQSAAVLAVAAVAWGVFSVYTVATSNPRKVASVNIRGIVSEESMMLGLKMREMIGTDVSYMVRWSRLVFYMGGRWVEFPAGSNHEIVGYARQHGADFIVEELKDMELSNGFRFMGTPGLSMVYSYSSPRAPYAVAVWRVHSG